MRKVLGTIALIVFLLIFGTWLRFHLASASVNNDPSTQTDFVTAKTNAEPLLQTLEKYRGDTGLYPATLDQLTGAYSPSGAHSFRYSARANDWVYKTDACKEREKSLRGWIMKGAKEYKKEIADFKSECLTGYRYYQLQSVAFPHDPQTRTIDRWAYYDSSNQQWSVGWCSHGSRGSSMATNGVCPWGNHGVQEPW